VFLLKYYYQRKNVLLHRMLLFEYRPILFLGVRAYPSILPWNYLTFNTFQLSQEHPLLLIWTFFVPETSDKRISCHLLVRNNNLQYKYTSKRKHLFYKFNSAQKGVTSRVQPNIGSEWNSNYELSTLKALQTDQNITTSWRGTCLNTGTTLKFQNSLPKLLSDTPRNHKKHSLLDFTALTIIGDLRKSLSVS